MTASVTDSGRRTFGVCDIENLLGTAPRYATASRIRSTMDAFCHSAGLGTGDLVVVAVNPALAVEVHRAAPAARLRCRRGPDGADRALLEELEDPFWVASRFDRVVVGSGDGIFTRAVAALNHTGVSTTVVARPGHLARTLRLAAQHVVPWASVRSAGFLAHWPPDRRPGQHAAAHRGGPGTSEHGGATVGGAQ